MSPSRSLRASFTSSASGLDGHDDSGHLGGDCGECAVDSHPVSLFAVMSRKPGYWFCRMVLFVARFRDAVLFIALFVGVIIVFLPFWFLAFVSFFLSMLDLFRFIERMF